MDWTIIKTSEEIEIMRQSGKILALVLAELGKAVRPGVTTGELEALAEKLIEKNGAKPAFKNYQPDQRDTPFPTTLCASINGEVVHAPALPPRVLGAGDIISLDLGLKYPAGPSGLFTDAAITVAVGEISSEAKKLIKVTAEALEAGIAKIRPGNFISDISRAIQEHVESNGFSVVRDLVGHGVGKKAHEPPRIPNFFDRFEKPVEPEVETLDDRWTVVTSDGKLSAHFEHTVAVTKNGHEILTKL